jgi:PBP1b-binding outer membrane lipoprotein LpoB
MKKLLILLLTITLLAACSSDETNNKESSKQDTSKKNESVEVDKKLFNVEVTLPASMFEGESIEDIKNAAKENDIKEVTENDDGSITYKMSKDVHKKLMEEISTSIKETVEETKTSEDFVSIKDITYNKSFSEFTMLVDKETYENSMDGFATMALGMTGMLYQMYDGATEDEYSVTIKVKDESTEEVFDEVVYPDALEETESDY